MNDYEEKEDLTESINDSTESIKDFDSKNFIEPSCSTTPFNFWQTLEFPKQFETIKNDYNSTNAALLMFSSMFMRSNNENNMNFKAENNVKLEENQTSKKIIKKVILKKLCQNKFLQIIMFFVHLNI